MYITSEFEIFYGGMKTPVERGWINEWCFAIDKNVEVERPLDIKVLEFVIVINVQNYQVDYNNFLSIHIYFSGVCPELNILQIFNIVVRV